MGDIASKILPQRWRASGMVAGSPKHAYSPEFQRFLSGTKPPDELGNLNDLFDYVQQDAQPNDKANGPVVRSGQHACHDTLPWLISFSLDIVPMCILTPKTLNICGLILSFIGGVMLFIRFLAHLIRASG